MMTEIWWKVFLLSVVTAVILKFLGVGANLVLLFVISFIIWAAVVCIAAWLSGLNKEKKNRPS